MNDLVKIRVAVTNNALGVRQIYTALGQKAIKPGQTIEVEVTKPEFDSMQESKLPGGGPELTVVSLGGGGPAAGGGVKGAEKFDGDGDGAVGGRKKKATVLSTEEAEGMTKAELTAFLDKRGDAYASDALKADLVALATAEKQEPAA